jgi:uncharacterized membrane protein
MNQQANEQNDYTRLAYEQTLQTYRMLADIRFKLLAFIPVVSGIAITFLTSDPETIRNNPPMPLVIGLLGFFVTLGIAFYDQRNSRLHDATISYARRLEEVSLPPSYGKGHITEMRRPGRQRLFGIVEIWHDRALALIYGSVLGAWLFPVSYAISKNWWIAGSVAILAAILFIVEFHRLEKAESEESYVIQRKKREGMRA